MEDETLVLPAAGRFPEQPRPIDGDSVQTRSDQSVLGQSFANQPGAQAMEALAWAIAQEFVVAFDEFNDSLLDDEPAEPLRVQTAGQ